jgi:hypothetical protein
MPDIPVKYQKVWRKYKHGKSFNSSIASLSPSLAGLCGLFGKEKLNMESMEKRRQKKLENAVNEYKGLPLAAIAEEARRERKFVNSPSRHYCRITRKEYHRSEGANIDWDHLKGKVRKATSESTLKLPWNISNLVNGNVAPNSYPRFVSREGAKQVAEKVNRFCGWIKAIEEEGRGRKKYPAIRKVIGKTQSPRGMHSQRTSLNLWDFALGNPSPGWTERMLWKIKIRAEEILSSYKGAPKPSWESVAIGLMGSKRTGKAAVIAVANTMSCGTFLGHQMDYDVLPWNTPVYKRAREWLTELHKCRVEDATDGVEALRQETPSLRRAGVSVYTIAIPARYAGYTFEHLVVGAGRSYHSRARMPYHALREAIDAWKRRKELEMENRDIISFLKGETGVCPLFFLEDSFGAGNCATGTRVWLRRHGFEGMPYLPGEKLLPYIGDPYVDRTVSHRMQAV